jgi:hypothetical protein
MEWEAKGLGQGIGVGVKVVVIAHSCDRHYALYYLLCLCTSLWLVVNELS